MSLRPQGARPAAALRAALAAALAAAVLLAPAGRPQTALATPRAEAAAKPDAAATGVRIAPPPAVARLMADAPLPAPQLPVSAASVLVSGARRPLWSFHGNAELAIASTTKLMTALVVLQRVRDLDTVFTQMNWTPAPVDSQIGLVPGERMTVHDLLLALLLPSADDAAMDLAYNVGGGSIGRFVGWMNADARALKLTRTHYSSPVGFDTPGNYSTADDLVRLGAYLMRHKPLFRHIVGLSQATLTSGRYVRHITNTNDLLVSHHWIHGIKTGTTDLAGHVLVADARRHGLTLVAAVLGTDSDQARDSSMLSLLDWAYAQFRRVRVVRAGEPIPPRALAGPGASKRPYALARAPVLAARGYRAVLGRGARVRLLVAPARTLARRGSGAAIPKGTVVGHLRVIVASRLAAQIPLVLGETVPVAAAAGRPGHPLGTATTLPVLMLFALLLGGGAAAARFVRRRRRRGGLELSPVTRR